MSSRLAPPLFGAFAHSDSGRALLTPDRLFPHVARWTADVYASEWAIDPRGVALFRPACRAPSSGGGTSVLAVRGTLRIPPAVGDSGPVSLIAALDADPDTVIRACRGEFLIAHISGATGRFVLARSHLGTRSLFLRRVGPLTLFASEPDGLTGPHGTEPVEIDQSSLFWFLAFGAPAPGRTLAHGIAQIPAAHIAQGIPGAALAVRRYWSPLSTDAPSEATPPLLDRIETLLRASISAAAPGQERIALALSGGVDSSLLLALMRAQEVPPDFAVTVRFEAGQDANEDNYARYAADRYGVPLETVRLSADGALDLLDQVVGLLPEPCAAWAALSHAAVMGRLGERATKLLVSGFGSDEIFGGYDHFRIAAGSALRAASRERLSDPRMLYHDLGMDMRARASGWLFPGVARFFNNTALRRHLRDPWRHWSSSAYTTAFYQESIEIKPEAAPIELFVAHECQHRIPDIVFKSFEPIGRRYGVTSVYPFLEPDLCQLATGLRLEDRYRTSAGTFSLSRARLLPQYKWALMQLAARHLPAPLLDRPRVSYTAPFALWMRVPRFARYVDARIGDSRLWELGMLKRSAFEEARAGLEAGPGPMAHRLWILLVLALWYDRYAAP